MNDMDEVEILNAMRNMAKMARVFYNELIEQKFSEQDALQLTRAYIVGAAGGRA